MMKLGIVEDERIEREAIRRLVSQRYGGGVEISFEASNGKEAIEKAFITRPDILLFDIQMPGINGIEAASKIKRELTYCEIAMLTAYRNFDYAQEALKIGVSDYLVKPYSNEKFYAVMDALIDKVEKKYREDEKRRETQQSLKRFKTFLDRQIINDMISGRTLQNEEAVIFSDHLGLKTGFLRCVIFMPENEGKLNERQLREVRNKLIFWGFYSVSGIIFSDRMIFLLIYGGEEKLGDKTLLNDIFDEAVRTLSALCGEKYVYAYSLPGKSVKDMNLLYRQALKKLPETHALSGAATPDKDIYDLETKLIGNIIRKDHTAVYEILNRVFIKISEYDCADRRKERFSELCLFIDRNVRQFLPDDSTAEFTRQALQTIARAEDFETVKSCLNRYVSEYLVLMGNSVENGVRNLIRNVKEYITGNVEKQMSLKDVAEHIRISPYYLSREFKRVEGINFKEFVLAIKMEKATALMREKGYNVNEAAWAVGYSDPNSFSRAFKKYRGESPKRHSKG